MDTILLGKPEVGIAVGSVWIDLKGKIGLAVGETEQGYLLQINQDPDVIEIIPRTKVELFVSTVICVGDL